MEADVGFACFRINQNEYRMYLILHMLAKVSSEDREVRNNIFLVQVINCMRPESTG